MLSKKYSKAFSEVYSVISVLNTQLKSKIPEGIIEGIRQNKDEDYVFVYDYTKTIDKQDISEEAKSIIAYLYKEYICSEDEKAKWKEYDRFRIKEMEKLKKRKFENK